MKKVEVIELELEELGNILKITYCKHIRISTFRRYFPNINGKVVFDRCIEDVIKTGSCEHLVEEVLNDLCHKKVIEAGNYIII